MGTLCGQDARKRRSIDNSNIEYFVKEIKAIAKNNDLTYEEALKTYEILAYERRTEIMIDDGDFTDENMCGIGKKIGEVAEALESVATSIEKIDVADMDELAKANWDIANGLHEIATTIEGMKKPLFPKPSN